MLKREEGPDLLHFLRGGGQTLISCWEIREGPLDTKIGGGIIFSYIHAREDIGDILEKGEEKRLSTN